MKVEINVESTFGLEVYLNKIAFNLL
jgi:hypothetical protein